MWSVAAQGGWRGHELEARRPIVASETMRQTLQFLGRKEEYEEDYLRVHSVCIENYL
jgi:hypothetical protein